MLRVRLFAIGDRVPNWINLGFNDYLKRFRNSSRVEFQCISSSSAKKTRVRENTKSILSRLNKLDFFVLLDSRGHCWTTEELAKKFFDWELEGKKIAIGIGGPDGWDQPAFLRADVIWSLSKLTFPHMLTRLIVIEQLYRIDMIRVSHPYHKIE